MVSEKSFPDLVIRLGDVALSQQQLASSLGVNVERYESARSSQFSFAQVNFDTAKDWSAVAASLEMIGPKIRDLIERHAIGSATIDVAVYVPQETAAISSKIPARIALLAGQGLIDIETSIYSTASNAATSAS